MPVDPWRIQINASSKLLYIRPWCRPSNQQPQLGELSPPSQAHQAFFCLASVFCAGWASLQFVASSCIFFWQLLFRFRAQGLGSPSSMSLKNLFGSCELQIVSDANSYFINKILHSYGLHHYFPDKNIHTNPAFVAENGALHVLPFHAADEQLPPHGCNLCPPNMCKV